MKIWVVVGIAIVASVWLGLTLAAPSIQSWLWPDANVERSGQIGDSFGVVSSLFTGLGSLGVVIVLAYDLRHRKEEFRPFVTATLPTIKLSRASRGGSPQLTVSLELDVALDSVTSAPALNLHVVGDATGAGTSVKGNVVVANAPLHSGPSRLANLMFTATGPGAEALVKALVGSGVNVALEVEYDALNATRWVSKVSFLVKARVKDAAEIEATLDPDSGISIEPSSTEAFATPPTFLEGEAVPGSWSQSRR